ncbi:AEC family transporter [Clostridium fallax]|uniref:Membrane transport protein n=1 Tax=Clostridium fallax TaxID=1533 RepID=A0A1M4W299_9CLOT|nr:AEC family transporter [Clostridium fallax]SHE75285.1 hypothetical protein SAMN05443638_11018 [Clostridium fallax]SQB22840.1 auxin efflux carrier [Clostridium fallax]
MIFNAFNGALTLIILITVGYILGKKKICNKHTDSFITSVLIYISLPAFMIANMTTKFSQEEFSAMLLSLIFAFICQSSMFLIGIIVTKMLNIENNKKGTFCCLFSLSNSIFIGLPVCLSIFKDVALPYILTFYVANTLCFWTVGVYFIKRDTCKKKDLNCPLENLKNLITPPLIAFIISILLILLNIKLPKFLLESFSYLGGLTTPLAAMFIGSILSNVDLKSFRFNKKSISIIFGRFIVAPILMAFILSFTNLKTINKEVFIVMASMPVMNLVAIMSKKYNGDYKFATIMNPVTLLFSFIFIPIYIFIFTFIL